MWSKWDRQTRLGIELPLPSLSPTTGKMTRRLSRRPDGCRGSIPQHTDTQMERTCLLICGDVLQPARFHAALFFGILGAGWRSSFSDLTSVARQPTGQCNAGTRPSPSAAFAAMWHLGTDEQPMATVDAAMAKHADWYPGGSQSQFSEPLVIHLPSEPIP